MLDRTTDLTSNRLFHNKDKFYRYSKTIAKIFKIYNYATLDSNNNTTNFTLKMAKLGIFFSGREEEAIKYHLSHDKYCDRCGREFNILGLIDNKHYCIQVPNKSYNLCIECDSKLKESGYESIINKLLSNKNNKENFTFQKEIFQIDN